MECEANSHILSNYNYDILNKKVKQFLVCYIEEMSEPFGESDKLTDGLSLDAYSHSQFKS